MRKLLFCAAAAVALVLVAALAAPYLIPAEVYKDRLAIAVKDKTGRDLRIAGPLRVSILPRFGLVAEEVSLSSPPGGFTTDFLKAQRIEGTVKLAPLLHGAVEIDQVKLQRPKIAFEVDREGRRNWVFRPPPRTAASTPATRSSGGGFSLAVRTIAIDGGAASYRDHRTGKEYATSDIDLRLSLPGSAGPAGATGSGIWNDEKIGLDATIASLAALRDGGASAATIKLTSAPLDFGFDGNITGGKDIRAAGPIELQSPDARRLSAWLGFRRVPSGAGFGAVSVKGRIDADRAKLSLTDSEIRLGKARARGTLALERGVRPVLSGVLDVDDLDFDAYLKPRPAAGSDAAPTPAATAGAAETMPPRFGAPPIPGTTEPHATAPPTAPTRPAPERAATGTPAAPAATTSPWSDARLDLSPLKAFDAALKLRASLFHLGDVTVDKADIALRLDNGRLQVEVPEMTLYRGTGMARISLDTGDGSPNLATRLELRGVTVAPLFHDLADIDQLSGVGDISLDVKGSGATPRELVSSLAGSASIALTDGALGATGLSELMKSIAGPFAAKTSLSKAIEFQSLAATGAIADGVLRNNDLKLNSPKVSATGAGTADLSRRQLDYAADVNSPELAAKIAITGGWDDPTYKALSVTITGGKGGRLRDLLRQIR